VEQEIKIGKERGRKRRRKKGGKKSEKMCGR
jgi:hypothetical protein